MSLSSLVLSVGRILHTSTLEPVRRVFLVGTMGNQDSKFKGPGKVLGTGEVVNAPKTRSSSILGKISGMKQPASSAQQKATPTAPAPRPKPSAAPVSEAEREERRKAAAAAAEARERAWEERLARQRARREEAEGRTGTAERARAWNEVSPQPELPPADPALLRKQKEAADALTKSGFNPYQATMSTATAARNMIDTLHLDDSAPSGAVSSSMSIMDREPLASVEEMQKARARLQSAMRGSDVAELEMALSQAEQFGVPEIEEASELLSALTELRQTEPELSSDGFDAVISAVNELARVPESADKRAACLNTLQTLLKNLVEHPENPKFRKIRLENKTVREKVVEPCQGQAVVVLQAVGFEQVVDEEGQQCLVVPDPETLLPEIVDYARGACTAALARIQELL